MGEIEIDEKLIKHFSSIMNIKLIYYNSNYKFNNIIETNNIHD